ncbi:MAG: hypothetical protein ACOVRM_06425, partial [Planctomycetaceae bacterium]
GEMQTAIELLDQTIEVKQVPYFGEAVLRDGITRCVNRLEEDDLQRGGDAEIQSFPSPQVV